jgi:hypothetical protein
MWSAPRGVCTAAYELAVGGVDEAEFVRPFGHNVDRNEQRHLKEHLMRCPLSITCSLAAGALVFASRPALAEPVTFAYAIQVTERCLRSSDLTRSCAPFVSDFPLTLTFDRTVTSTFGDETVRGELYGPPTFSAVPLPVPGGSSGEIHASHAFSAAFLSDSGTWRLTGDVATTVRTPQ